MEEKKVLRVRGVVQYLSTASEDHVVGALRRRFTAIGLSFIHITGHCFHRGAAQYAQYADEMASPVTRSRPSAAGPRTRWIAATEAVMAGDGMNGMSSDGGDS
ncbi:hypothetical protein E4U40_007974 [Claviceps sp. LM458 group G5]|nr:hypothetical protein E4U40_007974 [Claviceps sp. LM458 group G5]